MKNLLKYSGLLAAGVMATVAMAQPTFTASDSRAELIAPGAWAAYMQLTNTSPAPALITGVNSPQFASADLVVRSGDRFAPQTALYFSGGESGDLRASAAHVLLANPVSTDTRVTLNFELSDGSSSAMQLQLYPDVESGNSAAETEGSNSGSKSERQGAKKSRVSTNNPSRR